MLPIYHVLSDITPFFSLPHVSSRKECLLYICICMHASLCALPHLGLQQKPGSSGVQALRPISSACLPLQCYRRAARGAAGKCDQLRTFMNARLCIIKQTHPPRV